MGILSKYPIIEAFRDILSTGSGDTRSSVVVTLKINEQPHVLSAFIKIKISVMGFRLTVQPTQQINSRVRFQ